MRLCRPRLGFLVERPPSDLFGEASCVGLEIIGAEAEEGRRAGWPPQALPVILGPLEEAKAEAWARLLVPPLQKAEAKCEERLLTPQEAAAIAQISTKRIYSWARGQRWARRLSRKCLRISEQGFRRWLQARS